MKMTDWFLEELRRETERSRKALAHVPAGKTEWKPHDKSMAFGYLAQLVATMPNWVAMAITQDELDLNAPGGSQYKLDPMPTSVELTKALDDSVAKARAALQNTTDDFLNTKWKLLFGGQVVWEAPRHEVISDTLLHQSHHRGQMTVYLRLLGATVPALYGPSADERAFA
jgi:uncharacterized damage-inducible protein DinB